LCALRALGKRDFEPLTADYYERDDPKLIEDIVRNIMPRRGCAASTSTRSSCRSSACSIRRCAASRWWSAATAAAAGS
ncbi:MAG: hypothetical protein KC464_15020, partial [Myxococcales bacterium]|nr:hypothetical protein [Myxococcales bacterium]